VAKLPKVRYTKFTRVNGKIYAYFNTGRKVAGKAVFIPLPPYSSVGFWDSHSAAMGARTKRAQVIYTVASLADAYQRSTEFDKLSAGTRAAYASTIRKVVAEFGKFPLEAVERGLIREALDDIPGAASRNLFVAAIGVLFKWARGRDLTDRKPTDGIAKEKTGEHEPWPIGLLTAALSAEHDLTRLAVCLLYYSGQRIGDAVKMRWSDVRNGKLALIQQKTGKPMLVPIHSAIEAELARVDKRGLTILADEHGRPVSAGTVRKVLKAYAAEIGFAAVPHGLRKNAVNSMLEAGCTTEEVQAITGQSAGMVAHYAKGVDQHRLGEAAILKLERRTK